MLAVAPPIATFAHRYEVVETIQFCLLAFALPALVVVGWPLRWLRGRALHGLFDRAVRIADARRRHPSTARSLSFVVIDVALVIAWRTPALMDALERHAWVLAAELVSLTVGGILVWVELVRCPPLEPRLPRPRRAVMAAVSMWAAWTTAYVVGFSQVSWYAAFHHVAGGLGASADQELSTGLLWFGAAAAFLPVIFTDLVAWLRNGEDPDAELRALVRREKWWGPPR